VSKLPLMNIKFRNFDLKQNWPKFAIIIAGLFSSIVFQWLAVPVVFFLYIILSLLTQNKTA
jgi:CDP-diacylglycerol---serine O-phosphatidyltransferase